MGPSCWQMFLDECVEDLSEVILYHGVCGLLSEFEDWLTRTGALPPHAASDISAAGKMAGKMIADRKKSAQVERLSRGG